MAVWKVFYDQQETEYAGDVEISKDSSLNEAIEMIDRKIGDDWKTAYPVNAGIKVLKDI